MVWGWAFRAVVYAIININKIRGFICLKFYCAKITQIIILPLQKKLNLLSLYNFQKAPNPHQYLNI